MAEPNPPRFRIRLEDGAELPVASVEALARRVARGDVGPSTLLFDGSTGKWHAAAEAPVVQFILDELGREGRELPHEWEAPAEGPPERPFAPALPDGPADGPQDTTESALLDAPRTVPPTEASPPDRDPLDLKLTPASVADDIGPALKNAFASVEGPGQSVPPRAPPSPDKEDAAGREGTRPPGPRARDEEWVTAPAEGGLFTPAPLRPAEHAVPTPVAGTGASVARRKRRPAPAQGWAWLGFALVGVVTVVGLGLLLSGGRGDAELSEPSPESSDSGAGLAPPPGLEAAAERAMEVIELRFASVIDSTRAAAGLAAAPPETWLSGYYLANAAESPEVRDYWERYGAFVEDLRILDRALVADVIENELGPSVVPASDRAGLANYVEQRYVAALPRRQEVFTQLSAVASAAISLHDFLTEAGDAIRHTPALGAEAIPRDPVLEVGTDDPVVREGLEVRLDAIFDALDRSRGGGPPPQAGLEEDLFGRFGTF